MLLAVGVVTSLALLFLSLDALNSMDRKTRHWVRVAYVCVACGAFGTLIAPLYGLPDPHAADVLIRVGVTTLCAASRRRVWMRSRTLDRGIGA